MVWHTAWLAVLLGTSPGVTPGAFLLTSSFPDRQRVRISYNMQDAPHVSRKTEQYLNEDGTVNLQLTNVAVAEKLAVNHSTISRIRSGQRYPSRELMRKIEGEFDWKVVHQLDLLPDKGRNLRYAQEFEKKIIKRDGRSTLG
ncbi:HTH DNA binding protein [Arthrobacter phage Greenhouse]|uniref:Helix-turn-helix DNA-binding domain protein n=4 Tax=Korravirus TaxID=1982076 RepID=A0A1I9SE86_9CAUD|nr:HTH DNA binding protein [Arthrobacter phage Greenhouse]YP_010050318.1 HTH DNA binding protein [Arthrobacter phage Nubia]AOZ65163.1 helix-turn-helix DNA-binding domain protein [Arthrobacter phage Greenhouse]ASR83760.1 helix-turn-helix DNA-binding domain protein [Arthrobacter phage Nubia]